MITKMQLKEHKVFHNYDDFQKESETYKELCSHYYIKDWVFYKRNRDWNTYYIKEMLWYDWKEYIVKKWILHIFIWDRTHIMFTAYASWDYNVFKDIWQDRYIVENIYFYNKYHNLTSIQSVSEISFYSWNYLFTFWEGDNKTYWDKDLVDTWYKEENFTEWDFIAMSKNWWRLSNVDILYVRRKNEWILYINKCAVRRSEVVNIEKASFSFDVFTWHRWMDDSERYFLVIADESLKDKILYWRPDNNMNTANTIRNIMSKLWKWNDVFLDRTIQQKESE